MAASWSAVFTAFSSSSVPGIEPQLDHRISQNTMEPEAEPEFGVKACCRMPSSVNVYAGECGKPIDSASSLVIQGDPTAARRALGCVMTLIETVSPIASTRDCRHESIVKKLSIVRTLTLTETVILIARGLSLSLADVR
jgi:hypothetical protein